MPGSALPAIPSGAPTLAGAGRHAGRTEAGRNFRIRGRRACKARRSALASVCRRTTLLGCRLPAIDAASTSIRCPRDQDPLATALWSCDLLEADGRHGPARGRGPRRWSTRACARCAARAGWSTTTSTIERLNEHGYELHHDTLEMRSVVDGAIASLAEKDGAVTQGLDGGRARGAPGERRRRNAPARRCAPCSST